jgi:hypothetical protein
LAVDHRTDTRLCIIPVRLDTVPTHRTEPPIRCRCCGTKLLRCAEESVEANKSRNPSLS